MTILEKQEAFKRLVQNPDFQVLVHEMNAWAETSKEKQLGFNPWTEQDKIANEKIFRVIVTETIPAKIQAFINWQEDAPDKQVAIKDRWSFADFLEQIKQMFQTSPPVA